MLTCSVYLRGPSRDEVQEFLTRYFPCKAQAIPNGGQHGPSPDDPALCIDLVGRKHLRWIVEHEPLPFQPSAVVVVCLSSARRDGGIYLREFLGKLLRRFDGIACEAFTEDHYWTLGEIEGGVLKAGRPFYDIEGSLKGQDEPGAG